MPRYTQASTNEAETATIDKLTETANDYKEKGNEYIRSGNCTEAVWHYSYAIKLNPHDAVLYSNRSLAFLKLKQLYYANEDAEKAIQLRPDWAKAYFRRAEVQAAAGQYDTSLLLYGRALQMQPNDVNILNAAKRAAALSNNDALYEIRLPWVGAGVGIILGVIIVISDSLLTKTPTLSNPSLMVLMVIAMSLICYGIARSYHYYTKQQRRSLLDPPINLLDEFKKSNTDQTEIESENAVNRNRYTKAQARQRFKRGKT